MNTRSRQQGFSLLETVVAFAILSSALALLFQAHAKGTRLVTLSHEYAFATALAESLLAESAAISNSPSLERSGATGDKFHWRLISRPFQSRQDGKPSEPDSAIGHFRLQFISVDVAWRHQDSDRSIRLESLKPLIEASTEDAP